MGKTLLLTTIPLVLCVLFPASGTTWYVDCWVPTSGDGLHWWTAFQTIQEGLNAANNGDTVIVAEGIYQQNVLFRGRNVVLRSKSPSTASVVANTIIDGKGSGSVLTFLGNEDESSILSGFTIRNGKSLCGGGICGGAFANRTHATIHNNIIMDNSATGFGGGLAFCTGRIQNNVIIGNHADFGGGGLGYCDGSIWNNTMIGNSAYFAGGGLYACKGTLSNSIIWWNGAPDGRQLHDSSEPTYSCIQNWNAEGLGNISNYPHFVDPHADDYHMQSWSACIDAGDLLSDFSNEPQPNGERVNMGAYGNTPEATSASADVDEDSLPDDWEVHFFGSLLREASDDPDGDEALNLEEFLRGMNPAGADTWYIDSSVLSSRDGRSSKTAFKAIQEAIDASYPTHTVIVSEGIYIENIHFRGKNIVLRSTDPLDPDVVDNTIIDGNKAGSAVTFSGTEDETCVLSGFTIRNGRTTNSGGGIRCSGSNGWTHATIENNVISGNSATGEYSLGGGIYGCEGLIQNNVISGNSVTSENSFGGGIGNCDGTIRNNIISGNSALGGSGCGGGLQACDGMIHDNIITGNSAGWVGGGLCYCHGIIRDNLISENSSLEGGGVGQCKGTIQNNRIISNSGLWGGGLGDCDGIIQNNLICGNSATNWDVYEGQGGGLAKCDGVIRNNTVVGNSAQVTGGGVSWCYATIQNCIFWNNTAPAGTKFWMSSWPSYSCIQDWTGGGEGNITENPRFVDPDGPDDDLETCEDNDYRLSSDSPCIDAGVNESWVWSALDLDGNNRVWRGELSWTVDMGAYEYGSFPFRCVGVVKINGVAELTWNSRPGDTYTVWSCADLQTGLWIEDTTISSQGTTSFWTDTAPVGRMKFYRVEME